MNEQVLKTRESFARPAIVALPVAALWCLYRSEGAFAVPDSQGAIGGRGFAVRARAAVVLVNVLVVADMPPVPSGKLRTVPCHKADFLRNGGNRAETHDLREVHRLFAGSAPAAL
jgi:hypothetical protein